MAELSYFLLVLVSVFFITDPFANIPIFGALFGKTDENTKRKTITTSYVVALVAFFLFSFFGLAIFGYLNIDFSSFKIAGGILLGIISIEMLLGLKTRTELTQSEQEQAEEKENLAITPMAIPLITGPGAITTGVVLFSRAATTLQIMEFVAASLIAFALGYVLLMQSERITRVFGVIGMKIATRVMGLLLMSLAVQFIINGLRESGLGLFI